MDILYFGCSGHFFDLIYIFILTNLSICAVAKTCSSNVRLVYVLIFISSHHIKLLCSHHNMVIYLQMFQFSRIQIMNSHHIKLLCIQHNIIYLQMFQFSRIHIYNEFSPHQASMHPTQYNISSNVSDFKCNNEFPPHQASVLPPASCPQRSLARLPGVELSCRINVGFF